jgi:hypothetical protein
MNKNAVFEAWAPSGARWSDWVKPVLFATLPEDIADDAESEPGIDFELTPAFSAPGVALVIDLPREDSVAVGLALALRGIRPVPLFNALPGGASSLVDVSGIQRALVASAGALRRAALAPDAPPAFLLDALRREWRRALSERICFDNRSISVVADFPSADTLRKRGISRVLLIRRWYLLVPGDLVGTLAAWHAAGLAIELHDVASERAPEAWSPPRLLWLHRFWFQSVLPRLLFRDDSGAFGALKRAPGAG